MENIHSTLKNLEQKKENIEKMLEKGNDVIVLQLGSHSLRLNFANDDRPARVRNLLAVRSSNSPVAPDPEPFLSSHQEILTKLRERGYLKNQIRPHKSKPRSKQDFNLGSLTNRPSTSSKILFQEQVFWVQNNPDWQVIRPIKYGLFNTEMQGGIYQCLDYLHLLFIRGLEKLGFETKQTKNCNLILVVPDVFNRTHIKIFIQTFFKRFQFKNIYIGQQSVLSTYTLSCQTACIVDIGYQKISVCCVSQGIILPGTLIRKNYGLRQVDQTTIKVSNKNLSEDQRLMPTLEGDLYQIQKIREKASNCIWTQQLSSRQFIIQIVRKGRAIETILSNMQGLTVGVLGLFYDGIFQGKGHGPDHFNFTSDQFGLFWDPEDYFQEFSGGAMNEPPCGQQSEFYDPGMHDPFVFRPLNQMIAYSILNVKDFQLRRRFASNVLLIGGGTHINNVPQQIQKSFEFYVSKNKLQWNLQKIQALNLKDNLPVNMSWVGGSILPKLDSMKQLWIKNQRFMGLFAKDDKKQKGGEFGLRYFKEKLTFQW